MKLNNSQILQILALHEQKEWKISQELDWKLSPIMKLLEENSNFDHTRVFTTKLHEVSMIAENDDEFQWFGQHLWESFEGVLKENGIEIAPVGRSSSFKLKLKSMYNEDFDLSHKLGVLDYLWERDCGDMYCVEDLFEYYFDSDGGIQLLLNPFEIIDIDEYDDFSSVIDDLELYYDNILHYISVIGGAEELEGAIKVSNYYDSVMKNSTGLYREFYY